MAGGVCRRRSILVSPPRNGSCVLLGGSVWVFRMQSYRILSPGVRGCSSPLPQPPKSLCQRRLSFSAQSAASRILVPTAGRQGMIPLCMAQLLTFPGSLPTPPSPQQNQQAQGSSRAAFAGTKPLPAAPPSLCASHRCDAQRLCCRLRFY